MKDLLLDTQNDLDFSLNKLQFSEDYVYIQQKINTTIRLILGEWFLDITAGIPLFTEMLGKENIDPSNIEAILKAKILSVAGVLSITSFDMSLSNDRKLSVDFSCDTDLGELSETIEL